MSSQEQEIQEALAIAQQCQYTITRPPRNQPELFGEKVTLIARSGNTATITTASGQRLNIEFGKFRFYGPGGTIALFADANEETRLIEMGMERYTDKFVELLAAAGERLNWTPLAEA